YVIKPHTQKEELRKKWMKTDHPMAARVGWSLTTQRVEKDPDGLDIEALLERIDTEISTVPEVTQWTMNFCLIEIGINHPEFRDRAIAVGEKHSAYRNYPTPKGCAAPFAPIAITEMVSRQSK